MALRQATQGFLGLARALPCQATSSTMQTVRCMSLDGLKGFNENEAAREDMYFTKEDQRLLSKLMSKIKTQVCQLCCYLACLAPPPPSRLHTLSQPFINPINTAAPTPHHHSRI